MKALYVLILASLAALMAGCEATGLEIDATPQAFTPGLSADTRERTWENGKPCDKTVENAPAFQ
jgi:hypothetical protein